MNQTAFKPQPQSPLNGLPHPVQEYLFQLFAAWPQVEKVFLFGSRARGDAAERADIDLAVVAPTANTRQWLDIAALVAEAPTLLPIDLVRWEEAPAALRENIVNEGIVVYERGQTEPKPE